MSAEQALANAISKMSDLTSEVQRFRDAAMGLNAIYPTITEGRQAVADGKYFSVPGNGAYMRLYRRTGSSAALIAEFPDRTELNSVIAQLGPILGRGVVGGSGDLMARGFLGIGSDNMSTFGGDLDDLKETGPYFCVNAENAPTTGGSLFVVSRASGARITHLFIAEGTPRVYFRNYNSGRPEASRWSSWRELFDRNSILGTVSQSGGVPTGAIIERGSNANGEYTKFASGLLIMHTVPTEVTLSANAVQSVTFGLPVSTLSSFSNGLTYAQNTGGAVGLSQVGRIRCPTATTVSARIENSAGTEATSTFVVTHIGHWY